VVRSSHAARYLGSEAPADPTAVEHELEGLVDLLQPGWRDAIVYRRFLPSMLVANALPTAHAGGLAGRPAPQVPGIPGLAIAGDWVGPEGLLADAALVSARAAARALLEQGAAPHAA
jgi:hypothetical protein